MNEPDQPFRKLQTPVLVGKATARSQAIQGLRMFGVLSEEGLSENFGVDKATLERLRDEGLRESKEHKGRTWWRLTPAGETADP